jgi:hypothetical protein
VIIPARRMNYARRQQYRRLSRAGAAGFGSAGTALLALVLASLGAISLALVVILAAVVLGFYARHWLALAGRSRVGARSEDQVRDALAILEPEGWRLRHSLPWSGPGDIDSVAIAPTGIAFAIETKDKNVRGAPSDSRAPAGRVAAASPTKVVPAGRLAGPVRGSRPWSGALPRRGGRRADRPPGGRPAGDGSHSRRRCRFGLLSWSPSKSGWSALTALLFCRAQPRAIVGEVQPVA